MGCCTRSFHSETNYEKFLSEFFQKFPLMKHTGVYCLNQFILCEKESTRNTVNLVGKENKLKEYSKDKYYEVIERLFSVRIIKEKEENSNKNEILMNRNSHFKVQNKNYLSNIPIQIEENSEDQQGTEIKRIYLSITPSFNSLYDLILKNKPKHSFILFLLPFIKDNLFSKAKFFLKLFDSDFPPVLTSFQTIISSYALMIINFQYILYECIESNYSLKLMDQIEKEFNIRLNFLDLNQWNESNISMLHQKTEISNKFSMSLTKELLSIVISNKENVEKARRLRIDLKEVFTEKRINFKRDAIETSEKFVFLSQNGFEITLDDISLLIEKHNYLFDASKLRRVLIEFDVEE